MYTSQRFVLFMALAVLVSVLVPGTVRAQDNRKVYVDDTGIPKATGSGQCGRPNYATIQAAVNDLSASRVVVCKGTYVEQVTVERSLTLEGQSGAVIQAPAGDAIAVVQFRGPQQSRLSGFTITGMGVNVAAGVRANGFVCEDTPCGPTQVSISRNRISDIYSSGAFGVGGTGIFIYQAKGNVEDNTVERYGAIGIDADGDDRADTFAQVDGNTIRGQGQGGPNVNQIGIRFDETSMDSEDNTISGNYGSGADGVGYGIQVVFANGSIRDNTVKDNHTGVHYGPGAGVLRSNTVSNNTGNGIELFSTVGATIVENKSSNNGDNGIFIANGATGNTVRDNKAHGNKGVDLFDNNGMPLVNTYVGNRCATSNPSGLCKS